MSDRGTELRWRFRMLALRMLLALCTKFLPAESSKRFSKEIDRLKEDLERCER